MQNPSVRDDSLTRATLAERFVGFLHLPYSIGCLFVGFFLLGQLSLAYLYKTLTSGLPNLVSFFSDFEMNDPLFALYIVSGLLSSSFFLIPWYMRQRLLKAESTVAPILQKGRTDYERLFGRLSAMKPAVLIFVLLRVLIEVVFGILPAGSISVWLTNLSSDPVGFVIYDLWRFTVISVGLGSLLWTALVAGIGIRKIGGIPLRLTIGERSLFDGLRGLSSATVSLTEGYFAVCAVYAGLILSLIALQALIESDLIMLSSLLAIGSVLFLLPITDLRSKILQLRKTSTRTLPISESSTSAGPQIQGESLPESPNEATLVGNISLPDRSFSLGEEVTYTLNIANIGRTSATLLRLEELVPSGFKLGGAEKLDHDTVSYLDLKGRRLGYLKTYSTKTTIKATKTGRSELNPRILFMSRMGVYRAYHFDPKAIVIDEAGTKSKSSLLSVREASSTTAGQAEPTALVRGDLAQEGVAIQAKLKIASRELLVGDSFEAELEIMSVGTKPVTLEAIENIVGEGISPIAAKGGLLVDGKRLDLGRMKLPTTAAHNVSVIYSAIKTGEAVLAPSIIFSAESGSIRTWKLPETRLSIQRITPTMEFLVEAFTHDYMQRKINLENSGWRSLGEIAKSMKIPQSQLYGDQRYKHTFGPALEPLITSGLVEYRNFSGRGRGGQILKVRIQYEKEPVKRIVDAALQRR